MLRPTALWGVRYEAHEREEVEEVEVGRRKAGGRREEIGFGVNVRETKLCALSVAARTFQSAVIALRPVDSHGRDPRKKCNDSRTGDRINCTLDLSRIRRARS